MLGYGQGTKMDSRQTIDQMARNNPAFQEAFDCLKPGSEISIEIEQQHFALKRLSKEVRLLPEKATAADVEFRLKDQAILELTSSNPQQMGDLGVQVLGLFSRGEVEIRVIGSVFSVLTGGYLKIIQRAGPEFMGVLKAKGFSSLRKISAAIRGMR